MAARVQTTLYERLGGFVGITAIVDDFVERLFRDPRVGGHLQGNSYEAKRSLRLLTVELLCAAVGAPRATQRRSLSVGRQGLGMTPSEWQITVEHLTTALARGGLAADDRVAVLELVAPLQGQQASEPAAEQPPVRRAVLPFALRVAARAGTLRIATVQAGGR